MLEPRQVSFLDYPELVGTARFGVDISPAVIAERFRAVPERSFDDLGYFDFFGVRTDEAIFGFRMHIRSESKGSFVSVVSDRSIDPIASIARLCEIDRSAVRVFQESW